MRDHEYDQKNMMQCQIKVNVDNWVKVNLCTAFHSKSKSRYNPCIYKSDKTIKTHILTFANMFSDMNLENSKNVNSV